MDEVVDEVVDDEEEENTRGSFSKMEMEQDNAIIEQASACPRPILPVDDGDQSTEVLRTYDDTQVENEETSNIFVDEDSSSSRVLLDNDCTSTDSQVVPQQEGRKNKRKNFQPRNIAYNNQQNSDSEMNDINCDSDSVNDEFNRCNSGADISGGSGEGRESPLDLSEPPVRRSLLPRRFSPINHSINNFIVHQESTESKDSSSSRMECPPNPHLPDYAQMTMRRLLQMYGLPPHPDLNSGKFFHT